MRELVLKYKSKEWVLQIPEGWHELTPSQFVVAAQLYTDRMDDNSFLKRFYGLSDKVVRHLDDYQKYKLIEWVEFIQDARIPHSRFFLLSLPGTELMAPGPRLEGMCFQQFMMVDTFFSKYIETEDVSFLDTMISYLYTAKEEHFILFEKEKDAVLLDIDKHLSIVKSLDFEVKYAVFLNFIFIKKWLSHAYTHLFPESEADTTDKKMQQVKWLDIFDSFVGDNIPYMDKYQAMPCTDAFRIMNRKIREAKKR